MDRRARRNQEERIRDVPPALIRAAVGAKDVELRLCLRGQLRGRGFFGSDWRGSNTFTAAICQTSPAKWQATPRGVPATPSVIIRAGVSLRQMSLAKMQRG